MTRPHLRRRMLLESPQQVPDGAGGFVQDWQVLGTVWADVTAQAGREVTAGTANLSRVTLRIVLRAAPDGSSMRPQAGQRLREGARLFQILSVTEYDAAGRYLVCTTQQEVAR